MNTAAVLSHPIVQPPLPYEQNALEPVISANTVSFHYGQHHKIYVETLNKLIVGTEFADLPLESIVKATAGKADREAIFHNAAQAWNHAFYWRSLKPRGGGEPSADLRQMLEDSFGGVQQCKKELSAQAVGQFGSGWAWLIQEGSKLKVLKSSDANTPIAEGKRPLLALDVWEHAYYLDYQNRRVDHINAVLDKLLNWDFAAENLRGSTDNP